MYRQMCDSSHLEIDVETSRSPAMSIVMRPLECTGWPPLSTPVSEYSVPGSRPGKSTVSLRPDAELAAVFGSVEVSDDHDVESGSGGGLDDGFPVAGGVIPGPVDGPRKYVRRHASYCSGRTS